MYLNFSKLSYWASILTNLRWASGPNRGPRFIFGLRARQSERRERCGGGGGVFGLGRRQRRRGISGFKGFGRCGGTRPPFAVVTVVRWRQWLGGRHGGGGSIFRRGRRRGKFPRRRWNSRRSFSNRRSLENLGGRRSVG